MRSRVYLGSWAPFWVAVAAISCGGSDAGPDTGGAGSGGAGHGGGVGGGAGTTGAAGTTGGSGTTGAAGTSGATGEAGGTGEGRGGSSGAAGHAGTTGTGGATGAAGAGRGGTAGGAGHGGTTGAAGNAGSGAGQVCAFASGLNVAWVNFANDVPNPDLATFNTIFKNTHDAGGRIVRWWFHTNGSKTPGYEANGQVQMLPQSHIDGVKAILNAAHTNGVGVIISLWSFDMLQDNAGAAHAQNQQLLDNDAIRQSYVDNYLSRLVAALKGTPGLYAYEIFNEPEGMGPNGWATYRTTEAAIQKCVNWFSAAIHEADPAVPVTNGAVTFDYCSNVSGKMNYYSDTALRTVGGKANGTLDFYEVHYYTANGVSNSAIMHDAAYWKLDKELVMGELAAQDTETVAKDDLYTHLYDAGYAGAWAWSYDADWQWPAMRAAMQKLYDAHSNEIGECP